MIIILKEKHVVANILHGLYLILVSLLELFMTSVYEELRLN